MWLCNFAEKDVSTFMNESFWGDVTKAWSKYHYYIPSNPTQIAAQMLWFNTKIKIQKKCVFIDTAHKAGIRFLYNIWNKVADQFFTIQQIHTIYGPHSISYIQ